jgi:hypothetical protein
MLSYMHTYTQVVLFPDTLDVDVLSPVLPLHVVSGPINTPAAERLMHYVPLPAIAPSGHTIFSAPRLLNASGAEDFAAHLKAACGGNACSGAWFFGASESLACYDDPQSVL